MKYQRKLSTLLKLEETNTGLVLKRRYSTGRGHQFGEKSEVRLSEKEAERLREALNRRKHTNG